MNGADHHNSESLGRRRVFLFPGQSSVRPDAIARARRAHPASETLAQSARAALDADDAAAWLDGDVARLACNRDVQIVVFLSTQMYLAALQAEGIDAGASMGLSLGEYSHLVHIGALDFTTALRLVSERGRCFDNAPAGTMITILAVDHDAVADVVARARAHGTIVISNYNTPTQHVIAGSAGAVDWAAQTLEEECGAHTTVIERRVPMHSPLMNAPAHAFAPALGRASWSTPQLAYRPNVATTPIDEPRADDFVTLLTRHVCEPVQWRAGVDAVTTAFPEATFIEVGPGTVLTNMLRRSWRHLERASVDDPDGDTRAHLMTTIEMLRRQRATASA